MADPHPPELARLFTAADPPTHDAAWAAFVAAHSRLLLHTARSLNHDYDAAMDGYAHVLEALRSDNYRRLRAYVADGRGKFSTWLVVVARRLCLDFHRQRYGRWRGSDADEAHATRARLVDLISEEIDAAGVTAAERENPETLLQAGELAQALQ